MGIQGDKQLWRALSVILTLLQGIGYIGKIYGSVKSYLDNVNSALSRGKRHPKTTGEEQSIQQKWIIGCV